MSREKGGFGQTNSSFFTWVTFLAVVSLVFSTHSWAADSAQSSPPAWATENGHLSTDGYADLDWVPDSNNPTGLFRLEESSQGEKRSSYVEGERVRIYRSVPGEYRFTLQACPREASGVPVCGRKSNKLVLTVSAFEPAASALSTVSSEISPLGMAAADSVRGGPDQMQPGLWFNPDQNGHGYSFYWANRLNLPETHALHGFEYDLHGIWYTYEAKTVRFEQGAAPMYVDYQPLAARMKMVREGDNSYSGGIYVTRNGQEVLEGTATVTFGADNISALVEWSADFKLQRLSGQDPITLLVGSDPASDQNITHYAGIWNSTNNDRYQVIDDVGFFSEAVEILFEDNAGDTTWVQAVKSGNLVSGNTSLCFYYIVSGYAPGSQGGITFDDLDCDPSASSGSGSSNGARYFTDFEQMRLWTSITLPQGRGGIEIGSAASPVLLQKSTNFHRVYFSSSDSPCELVDGACQLPLTWFTDGDYPQASVFLRKLETGQRTLLANSNGPVVVDREVMVGEAGTYVFELRMGNSASSTLMAQSSELVVSTGELSVPLSLLIHSINESGSEFRVQWTHPEPLLVDWYELAEVVPGSNEEQIHTLSPGDNNSKNFSYPAGPYGLYRYRVRACQEGTTMNRCSAWTDTFNWQLEEDVPDPGSTQYPWRLQSEEAGSLITNIRFHYAMGYHFKPKIDGYANELGGLFNGSKTIRLFDRSSLEMLAEAVVSSSNDWQYSPISPVPLEAGREYTVAVYLAGEGGSYRSIPGIPAESGDISILASTYVSTSVNPNAIPVNTTTGAMYGQADIGFSAANLPEPDPDPVLDPATPETPPEPATRPAFSIDAKSVTTGATEGKFFVDAQGAANYRIPLMTAPGSGGLAPQMSLEYNSQGANDVVGVGWSIGGQSAISRCPQTQEQDGIDGKRNVLLDWGDRFCLDGQRLMAVKGTYGGDGTEYRLEIDDFSKIISRGKAGQGPARFEVWHGDGSLSHYGNSEDSRIEARIPGDGDSVMIWAVSRQQDAAGSYIDFEYAERATGPVEVALQTVRYTGNTRAGTLPYAEISFHYSTGRNDIPDSRMLGGTFSRTWLLTRIDSVAKTHSNSQTMQSLRSWYLDYGQDGFGRKVLESVQECSDSGKAYCYNPTNFSWLKNENVISGPGFQVGHLLPKLFKGLTLADVNGDGRKDFLIVEGKNSFLFKIAYAQADGVFLLGTASYSVPAGEERNRPVQLLAIDLNADGYQDVIYPKKTGGKVNWVARFSDSSAFGEEVVVSQGCCDFLEPRLASVVDFNGDGLADLVTHVGADGSSGQGNLVVLINGSRSDGSTAFEPPKHLAVDYSSGLFPEDESGQWFLVDGAPGFNDVIKRTPDGVQVFDYNGDGRVDLLARVDRAYTNCEGDCDTAASVQAISSASTSLDFNPAPLYDGDDGYFNVGFYIVFESNGEGRYSQREVVAKEARFGCEVSVACDPWSELPAVEQIRPVDINGDGLADLAYRDQQGEWYYRVNTGAEFGLPEPVARVQDAEISEHARFVDLTGDGYPEFLYPSELGNNAAKWIVHANDLGSGFAAAEMSGMLFGNDREGDTNILLDFTGDGMVDSLFVDFRKGVVRSYSTRLYLGRNLLSGNGYEASSVIERIVDGLGKDVQIQYGSLTDPRVHTRLANAASANWGSGAAVFDLVAPVYLVSDVSISAPTYGNASAMFKTEYHYVGAKIQAGGRGFLGFTEVIQWSPDSGIRTNTRYRQDFPYVGLPFDVLRELAADAQSRQSLTALHPGVLQVWPAIDSKTSSPGAALYGKTIQYSANGWRATGTSVDNETWSRALESEIEFAWSPQGELLKKTFINNRHGNYGRLEQSTVQTWGSGSSVALLTVSSTSTYHADDLSKWSLNRVSGLSVRHQRPNMAAVERTSSFDYDYSTGRKLRETTEPSNAEYRVVSEYELDSFGNRIRTTVRASGVSDRTSRLEYDSLGRFAVAEYNHFGQQVMRVHNWNQFGTAVEVSDIDGVVAESVADPMGRVFGNWTETGSWDWNVLGRGPGEVCPVGTTSHYRVSAGGKATTYGCLDSLQREIRLAKTGFDGRMIYMDTKFDSLGRVQGVSEPYFKGSTAYWNVTRYDEIGRILEVDSAGGDHLSLVYGLNGSGFCGVNNPNAAETTNALGQKQLEVKNTLGEIVAVYDDNCGRVAYQYDSIGNLLEVSGADNTRVQMAYDRVGRKISTNDPDKGFWRYQWNGLGEMRRQLDARGQAMDYEYDSMGRVTRRRELSGVASIGDMSFTIEHQELTVWQNATGTAVYGKAQPGKVTYQKGDNGERVHQKVFTYDKLGRVSLLISEIDGLTFSQETTYDQYGRKFQEFDASGDYRGLRYHYNPYGYLDQVTESREGSDGASYRDVKAMDARGNVEYARLGNGVEVFASHDAASGQLQSLEAYDSRGRELQEVDYLFDELDTLRQRVDRSDGRNLIEDFSYDSLNRLTRVELTAPANLISTPTETLALAYDSSGNITWKSDVGNYSYGAGAAGPHAVSFAGGQSYTYDANGNQVSGGGRTIQYSVFDKAVKIEKGDQFTEFTYGIAHHRITRLDGNLVDGEKTTRYIGNVEYVERDGGTHFKRHLAGVAMVKYYPSTTLSETLYVVKDHLGSVHNLTGEDGLIEAAVWMNFSAFGQRRASTWDGPLGLSSTAALNRLSNRGFTGHEHVDAMGVVHMNGRIYDPKLGRFLQADPLVQTPGSSQALNRYSYALNNPLSHTDPSGYFLKRLVKRWGRLIAALALSVFLPGGQGILATVFNLGNVYAQAAITGFIAGAITSGTFKGAVIGALTAVMVTGIVQANTTAKAVKGLAPADELIPDKCTAQHLFGSNEHSEGLYRIFVKSNGAVEGHNLITAGGLTDGDVIFTNGIRNGFDAAVKNATVHLHQAGQLGKSYILNFNPTEGVFADLLESSRDIIGAHTGWTHSRLAKGLAGVLDQASGNGVSGIHLVGHSQGGAITASALRYAGKAGLNLSSLSGGGVALHGAPVNAWMARNRLSGGTVPNIVSQHQFGDAVYVLGGLNLTNPLEVPITLLRVPALFSGDPSVNPHSMPCAGSTGFVCVY